MRIIGRKAEMLAGVYVDGKFFVNAVLIVVL